MTDHRAANLRLEGLELDCTLCGKVSGRELCQIGGLRAAEAKLLSERQANQALSHQLRVQDRRKIDWAKLRNEEWLPLMLVADGLRLDDADTFIWTPAGAADFTIESGDRTLNVQCTMAYDRPRDATYTGGHLHHLEMTHQRTQLRPRSL